MNKSEISQTVKDKYCMVSPHVESKKIQQTSEYNKKEKNSQIWRIDHWLPVGRGKRGGTREEIKRYKLL